MKKIAYSFILLLSVSCSSSAMESASIPEKQVETFSQEKAADKQGSDFLGSAIQYREDVSWLFRNTVFIILIVTRVAFSFSSYQGSSSNKRFIGFLGFFLFPLLGTIITALFSTYLLPMKKKKSKSKISNLP